MKGNVIQMNTLHLNSVRLNGIGKVQSVSLKGGSTEDPVFPPVEPPVEPTPTYTLSASVTNGKVSAKRNGSAVNLPYTANEGDTIVLEVTPNDGYTFEGWNDGNTDNPRSITMTADVVLSAECVEVVQPPVGNYIQFEDPAVEAICVANWSSDGIGLTEEDAAAVTSIGTTFKGNTEITSFNEFEYFTGVTSLTTSAFYSCSSLKAIKFPSSVTGIGVQAFYGCSALEGDLLLDNVTTIGHNAFNGCKKLTSVYAPVLGSIPQDGFRYCSGLQSVELGDAVTSIGIRGLRDCTGLQKIIVRTATPPTLGADALTSTNSCPIYVPDASLEAYKTATNWNTYADRIHPLSEIEGSLVFYDKLVGDGTAYINTEYYAKGLDSFAWDAEPPTSWNKFLFGCKNTKLNLGALTYAANQTYYLVGSTTTKLINGNNSARITRQMAVVSEDGAYKRKLIEGGNVVAELGSVGSYASAVSTTPLLVYACQKSATDTSADRIYNGEIRSFSITDIDGNTIMSLKPCTFAGEAGMWDEVNGKFYGNAATGGEFSVAND